MIIARKLTAAEVSDMQQHVAKCRVEAVLRQTNGNMTRAAQAINISRSHLYKLTTTRRYKRRQPLEVLPQLPQLANWKRV